MPADTMTLERARQAGPEDARDLDRVVLGFHDDLVMCGAVDSGIQR